MKALIKLKEKFFYFLFFIFYFLITNVAFAGLVPCSPKMRNGIMVDECTLCDFLVMAKNIITFLIEAAVILGVLFIVWGGFVIMIAGGSPERVSQGRKSITIAVTGIAIALGAWLIIGTVLNILGGGSPLPWTEIICQ